MEVLWSIWCQLDGSGMPSWHWVALKSQPQAWHVPMETVETLGGSWLGVKMSTPKNLQSDCLILFGGPSIMTQSNTEFSRDANASLVQSALWRTVDHCF